MVLKDAANEAYQTAVEECGASDDHFKRRTFVDYVVDDDRLIKSKEWRFCGNLGFGGKLCYDPPFGFRITCYREDLTPERQEMIDAANTRLQKIKVTSC